MPVALGFGRAEEEDELFKRLALCDLSALGRFGVKGPDAAGWLREQGVTVPEGTNTWFDLRDGGLVARLGSGEFLVEDGPEGSAARGLGQTLHSGTNSVRPVVRQDAALVLTGTRAREVMGEVCGLDFDSVDYVERPLFMTRVAVISALVLPLASDGTPVFRVWCDHPYGMYLWEELNAIVEEVGGGVIGVSAFFRGSGVPEGDNRGKGAEQ